MHEMGMRRVADRYGRGMRETPDHESGACFPKPSAKGGAAPDPAAWRGLDEAGRVAIGVACPGAGD